ncbi:MAG: hypothetical protein HY616_10925 [Candidatus Rokubacteria bacterium]|nr:hypothetical protein [Candidatus Rokubacteria bacterium]
MVGAGQTKFAARRADATFWELAPDAVKAAMQDAGLEQLDSVDSCVVGMFNDLLSPHRARTGPRGSAREGGFPMTVSGKIQKTALRRDLVKTLERTAAP